MVSAEYQDYRTVQVPFLTIEIPVKIPQTIPVFFQFLTVFCHKWWLLLPSERKQILLRLCQVHQNLKKVVKLASPKAGI